MVRQGKREEFAPLVSSSGPGPWGGPAHWSKTLSIALCLGPLVLILIQVQKPKTLIWWPLHLLEHNHWAPNDSLGDHWPGDLSGFDLDHDLFNRVHQTVLLWAILVYAPCFHHLLHQSGHPWRRVSPCSTPDARVCVSVYTHSLSVVKLWPSVNTAEQVFAKSFEYMSRSGVAGWDGWSILRFSRMFHTCFRKGCPVSNPTYSGGRFPFPCSLTSFSCQLFSQSQPFCQAGEEIKSQTSFNLHLCNC